MGYDQEMYRTTCRIPGTADEHFYILRHQYYWPASGFNLSDALLRRIYRENALAELALTRRAMS